MADKLAFTIRINESGNMLEKNIAIVNQVILDFFANNTGIKIIPAKDLMPEFIGVGLFLSDVKNGLPIRT